MWGGCKLTASIYGFGVLFPVLMKHIIFRSVEVQLEVSGAFPGMGELGEGAPSLPQVGRVGQPWKTRRQRARDPCGGRREVSHLPALPCC